MYSVHDPISSALLLLYLYLSSELNLQLNTRMAMARIAAQTSRTLSRKAKLSIPMFFLQQVKWLSDRITASDNNEVDHLTMIPDGPLLIQKIDFRTGGEKDDSVEMNKRSLHSHNFFWFVFPPISIVTIVSWPRILLPSQLCDI